jgi:hypothetical protein
VEFSIEMFLPLLKKGLGGAHGLRLSGYWMDEEKHIHGLKCPGNRSNAHHTHDTP